MSDSERLVVRGPKGERGEAGMSRNVRRAIVFLFALGIAIGVANLLFTVTTSGHDNQLWQEAVAASDHKFCAVVTGFTAQPVPKPADPAANPSREQNYQWFERFVRLGRSLGCKQGG
ncbi:MAG: hypothetical protein ACRDRJ_05765 [Streptosporangiaceae bacterium]